MPLIIGIILGWHHTFPVRGVFIATVLFTILTVLVSFSARGKSLSPSFIYVLVLLFGILKIDYDGKYVSDDSIALHISSGKTVELHGTIADPPKVSARSFKFVVDAKTVKKEKGEVKASGGVLVSVLKESIRGTVIDSLTYGRAVILRGELVSVSTARNPGEFDLRQYLHLNNIDSRLYLDKLDSNNLGDEASGNLLSSFVSPVRRFIAHRLDSLIGGDEARFLKGLIIGERSEIPLEVKTAFINSGVMHILAVSGLHVAIVTFIILIFLQTMRVPENVRIILTSLLLVYYIFLTGSAPSVTRSVIMAVIFLGAQLFERKSDVYNTLAFSAIVILLIDAKQLFQPGFQLSFVAVFSLIYLYPRIYAVRNLLPRALKGNRYITSIVAMVAVSIAAGVGTLPFTSIYFGKISVISFVANLVIVPLSNVILTLGMLTVLISLFSAWLASVYASATTTLTWLLLKAVDYFGNLPCAYIDARFTTESLMMFYLVLGVIANVGKREFRKYIVIVSLIVLDVWLYGFYIFSGSSHPLRVTFLDVGQGDAIVVQFPDGNTMLVDGGPRSPNFDSGARTVAPFLTYFGIREVNILVLSHPHSDHLGGIPYLLRHFKVGKVIDAGSSGGSSLSREYEQLIDSMGILRVEARAGTTMKESENVRMYVLHPSGDFVPRHEKLERNLNNQSIVIKLCYGETTLLLEGDTEHEGEEQMMTSYGSFVKSEVLKAGHHGSITSSSPAFCRLVHPHIAVISVGARNKFHHPSTIVLKRFIQSECNVCRTDESGAIVLESNGTHWSQVFWRLP
ncbi:MAG: DNA internalization-related competence protein ComEC/Rec2 [Ignavibacteriales bacterium]|nr:DNA internalization-related competence protein ComEC/Rec2 [Ignavibacteriales bacterium]